MDSSLYGARPFLITAGLFITGEMCYELLQLWGQAIVGLKRRTG